MEDICRLCFSAKFVNNDIFDEENALYLKMSLYLPIKVFKNDLLPQKVCDKCSCKVNDFYQFCNEAIEVQNRLRATFMVFGVTPTDSIDLTEIDIKKNIHSPPIPAPAPSPRTHPHPERLARSEQPGRCDQGTQTELTSDSIDSKLTLEYIPHQGMVPVKEEPITIKTEVIDSNDTQNDSNYLDGIHSDSSDDVSLLSLKKSKRKVKNKNCNGNIKENKSSKKIEKPKELKACLLSTLQVIKKKVKTEPNDGEVFNCCICFVQCRGRAEMLRHYREHSKAIAPEEPPPAPPAPDSMRCIRCQKRLAEGEWASHWAGHWARDRRPLRCAVCARTFKDHSHILKHSLKHEYGAGAGVGGQAPEKQFLCDVCEERFAYMRCLLAHRTLAHPEASARAPALRCAVCARAFLHHNSLRRHLAAHSGQRPFLCNVCGKALSSREHLKFHIRIHTGDKQHACRVCGKGFVKKCNLTLHERVHSGEKPHVCEHCGKAFSQRSTLVIHERYHSGARPYACALCGRGFVARGLLTMHLKTTCI